LRVPATTFTERAAFSSRLNRFAGFFDAELDHFGDLADDLDFQPCLGPADRYALD